MEKTYEDWRKVIEEDRHFIGHDPDAGVRTLCMQ
jgi:hypothetical protein